MSLNIVTEIDNRIKIKNVLMSVSDKTAENLLYVNNVRWGR